jgi:hypothetical protein
MFWQMPPEEFLLVKPSVQWSRMWSGCSVWAQPSLKRPESSQVPTLLVLWPPVVLRL